MFLPVTTGNDAEREHRRWIRANRLFYGVKFLDDATRGIFPNDLVLLGAVSGAGKSQLCTNIALSCMNEGKRVHFLALESSEYEIKQRMVFPLVMERYLADPHRIRPPRRIEFEDWIIDEYAAILKPYEDAAYEFFTKAYGDLHVFNKTDKFGVGQLIESVTVGSRDASLIIIDHAHYFDFDDDNENRALRQLAKTCRDLVLEEKKPIILVAHLRKKDRGSKELAPGMEEFQGSSDLYKIATRVITFGPGRPIDGGGFETYFRIPKNRFGGGVTRYLAKCEFSPQKGKYEPRYKLGWSDQDKFEEIDQSKYPEWAGGPNQHRAIGPAPSSGGHSVLPRAPQATPKSEWERNL